MKYVLFRGLITGLVLGGMYVSSVIGWNIGRWCYYTFG